MQNEEITKRESDDPQKGDHDAQPPLDQIPVVWRIVGSALAGVLILAAVAYWLPDMKERMKFFTESALAWVVLVVVAVQAYIYHWQAKIMGDSLVISQQSYMGVQKVEWWDKDQTVPRIVHLELVNVGNVPADEINLTINIMSYTDDEWARLTPNVRKGHNLSREFYYYGKAKLLKGAQPLVIPLHLDRYLSIPEITLIHQLHGFVGLLGEMSYSDGFGKQSADFMFTYIGANRWSITAPDEWKRRVEEITRKDGQTKQK